MNRKKIKRQQVFDKFGGKCAYTGKPLPEDWEVDHAEPRSSWKWFQSSQEGDALYPDMIENLLPTFKIINHYKRAKGLEEWRTYLTNLHLRLAKLPKKTRVEKRRKYVAYMLEVAQHFGITAEQPFNGVFYFETINTQTKNS